MHPPPEIRRRTRSILTPIALLAILFPVVHDGRYIAKGIHHELAASNADRTYHRSCDGSSAPGLRCYELLDAFRKHRKEEAKVYEPMLFMGSVFEHTHFHNHKPKKLSGL